MKRDTQRPKTEDPRPLRQMKNDWFSPAFLLVAPVPALS
jgi:hypothetical protein